MQGVAAVGQDDESGVWQAGGYQARTLESDRIERPGDDERGRLDRDRVGPQPGGPLEPLLHRSCRLRGPLA